MPVATALPQMPSCATALIEAWNAHDVGRLLALHADDYQGMDVALPRPLHGRAALGRSIEAYFRAFPDLRLRIERVVQQEEAVVVVWTARGTHRGPLLNIPATGRQVIISGVWILDLVEGRVRRNTSIWDLAGLLRALGLLPRLHPHEE